MLKTRFESQEKNLLFHWQRILGWSSPLSELPTLLFDESQPIARAKIYGRIRAADQNANLAGLVAEFTSLREALNVSLGTSLSAEESLFWQGRWEIALNLTLEAFIVARQSPSALSNLELDSIFAHAAVGFAVSTLDGRWIEANPRFCEITGYSRQDLLTLRISDIVAPEDRARDSESLDRLSCLSRLNGEELSHLIVEKRLLRRDREVVWIRTSISLVPGANGEKLVIHVAEDITAMREADRLRRESEERYVRLADSMPQIVWTAHPDGELDYFNQVWFDYSGTTYAENVGTGWAKAVHPEDLPTTYDRWTSALKSGEIYENEFRLRARDGTFRWHVARALPARGQDGKILKWYGTNTDIHEAKVLTHQLEVARLELESEQQKFRTIFADASTSMALLRGKDFVYEIANKSYLELFNNRELVGKPFVEALPELIGQEFPERARAVFETGIPYADVEARAELKRSPDSPTEVRYFDQTYTRMLDQNGKPYGVFIHAREVTDRVLVRRELEETAERFRIAVESANMGTWDLNPQTGIVHWSERTNEIFGVKRTERLLLEVATSRIHPEDKLRVEAAIRDAIDPRGSGDYQIEYRIRHDNGDIRWVSLMGKSFFENQPSGRVATRFTGTVLDVTDRMLAEVALRDAKERAEMASAAKSAFLANMSHEIRTPLGAIMGFVSLMRDEGLNQKMLLEYVAVIERNSVQLMRIIDDILDLSKVEAGMMLIEHVDFSLIELLSDFASLMGFRARDKGIRFELKAKSELPEMINSDPTRIRQILTNVVGNAIKFTERGRVQLQVHYHDETVEFEIEDTGRGISFEQAQNLFQPFSQADASTTRKFGGTGLGLVLTRRLSEGLGGSFSLKKSALDTGSIFVSTIHVQLPKGAQMVKALGFASEPIRNAGAPSQLRQLKVLLVEDSPDNQALFSIYLSRAGALIDVASDGAQGFTMALAGHYDVVLMDVQMPIMDGISTVKKLRAEGYTVPIIALTAHAMKEERIRCLEAGYTEFLSKPIQRNELIETLTKYIARSD